MAMLTMTEKSICGLKREVSPITYPGMLENLVAGELPQGTSCQDRLVKLCEDGAGIMSSIANQDIEGYRCKRDIMFCYDLRLSAKFVPKNQDKSSAQFLC